jgi:hypothetical protein
VKPSFLITGSASISSSFAFTVQRKRTTVRRDKRVKPEKKRKKYKHENPQGNFKKQQKHIK